MTCHNANIAFSFMQNINIFLLILVWNVTVFVGIHSNVFAGLMLMHVLKTVKGHISLFFNHPWCSWCKRQFPAHIGCFRIWGPMTALRGRGGSAGSFTLSRNGDAVSDPGRKIKQTHHHSQANHIVVIVIRVYGYDWRSLWGGREMSGDKHY